MSHSTDSSPLELHSPISFTFPNVFVAAISREPVNVLYTFGLSVWLNTHEKCENMRHPDVYVSRLSQRHKLKILAVDARKTAENRPAYFRILVYGDVEGEQVLL